MASLFKLSLRLQILVIWVGRIFAWAGLLLMLTILIDVVTREIKSSDWISDYSALHDFLRAMEPWASSTKLQELEWHLHGVLFLMCFGYAYLMDAHVRIELARERFKVKTRAVIEIFGLVLFLTPFCYLVITFGFDFAERSFIRNEGSSALTGLPQRWVIKSMIPIGFSILALAGLSVLLRCLAVLFGTDDIRAEAEVYLQDTQIQITPEVTSATS